MLDRYTLHCSDVGPFRGFLDVINYKGLKYNILNLSCKLTNNDGTEEEWENEAKCKLIALFHTFAIDCLPVFTKFMYMLRISPNFELYEDVFKPWCERLDHGINALVEGQIIHNKVNMEYVWMVWTVPSKYAFCNNVGLMHEEALTDIAEELRRLFDEVNCVSYSLANLKY